VSEVAEIKSKGWVGARMKSQYLCYDFILVWGMGCQNVLRMGDCHCQGAVVAVWGEA
jgi:hypothetical protein